MNILVTNRPYRLLFFATAVSNLGDGVSALVAFANRLPWFLFSIPAGVLVDRRDRRLLMIQADMFRLLLTTGVIALVFSIPVFPPEGNPLTFILALSGLALLLGTSEVIRDNAAQTVLLSIVLNSDLEAANG